MSAEHDDHDRPDVDAIDLYWRPGCGFCAVLDRGLRRAGVPTRRHNIWDDPDHAAVVRSHARGDETVPTVVIDDVGLVNPTVDDVLVVLAGRAPQLVPDGWEPPQPSRVGSTLRRLLGG